LCVLRWAGGQGAGGGAGRPGGGAGGARFDPAAFAAMREKLCAAPTTGTPDLSQLPEGMRARLLDENGEPDPARVEMLRQRLCSAEGEADVDRFAQLRTALCAEPPQLDQLPPQMLERLRGEDGEIDPERVKAFRERVCAADGAGGPLSQDHPTLGQQGVDSHR